MYIVVKQMKSIVYQAAVNCDGIQSDFLEGKHEVVFNSLTLRGWAREELVSKTSQFK